MSHRGASLSEGPERDLHAGVGEAAAERDANDNVERIREGRLPCWWCWLWWWSDPKQELKPREAVPGARH